MCMFSLRVRISSSVMQKLTMVSAGASGGIGLEIVHLFLEQGAKVTAQYNSTSSSIQVLQANLTSESSVTQLFTSAIKTFGPVQVVVNNHGVWPKPDESLADMPLDRWKRTIDTNLTSTFLVVREYMKNLKKEGITEEQKDKAAFVFITSSAAKFGEAFHADYASSKSAFSGLMLSMKNEIVKIAPRGRVNIVSPGWIKTQKKAEDFKKDPTVVYPALATMPLKKVGLPYDIATQVVFLSSNKVSGHVTGEIVTVNGGMEGRLLNSRDDIDFERI
ncbi:hypothetical protein D9758_005331 [Tetrapyrgos nigripes]|uniref:Uncharacterized protein n=1 Tax=Tetrapyrgos nigripes TaxID=182062 RepID=A0A8H5GHP1_9AGAR|nr:hypothetical protein D9758_005331 [Tetrapyrgos nigripes]